MEWKDIKNYEGLYMISTSGQVKSLNYNHTHRPHILAVKNHLSGYQTVTLCKKGVNKNKSIHVLVASAFIPNPHNLPVVNHKDGNKKNNNVSNLEWTTYSGNTKHAIDMGLRSDSNMRGCIGACNPLSKKISQYSKSGELIKIWDSLSDAARFYKCRPASITNCCKGRIKSLRGYHWQYF